VTGEDDEREPPFEDLLCFWDWWDRPRVGIAIVSGQPMSFDAVFSEELDDYTGEYELRPVTPAELEAELAAWGHWVAWSDAYDRGEQVGPYEPPDRLGPRDPAVPVRRAVPTWRLDPTFAERVPRHQARWRFVDHSPG